MKKQFLFLFLFSPFAYSQNTIIIADEAVNFINKEVVLRGKVIEIYEHFSPKSHLFFINIDKKYPENEISILIYEDVANEIKALKNLTNKIVKIKGIVTIYKEKPQIIIKKPEDLQIE
jgi:DNA/RNA endonuclease YhcR with UshA esterase domain